ncbi:MAG: hypothetical protein ACLFP9_07890 [Desulfonatronovibrio sp.]
MSKIDYLSEDLVDETLREAADTFFGKRKKVDEDLELFYGQVQELQNQSDTIRKKTACLNYLLLDDPSGTFWKKLDLGDSVYAFIKGKCEGKTELPWALSFKGVYRKAVLSMYDDLRLLVHDYLHGRYADHPEIKGKKIVTPNLSNLKAWAEDLNNEIEQINSCNRPDDVLAFARRVDVTESSKRESVGSGLEYAFNQELCFQPVDFDSLELENYPELPAEKKDYKTITRAAESIFRENKEQARQVLDKIKK